MPALDLIAPESVLSFIQSIEFPYYRGAVFPCELAFFLYECERAGIKCIIESGRGEGYSTAVLATYAQAKNIRVISVDMDADRTLAQRCRARLEQFGHLKLVTGNTFHCLPDLIRSAPASIALLIDGPKRHEAVYLSAAAVALGSIGVVAHHNAQPQTMWYPHFAARFPETKRFEDSALARCVAFPSFRAWEKKIAGCSEGPGRDLDCTSLVLSVLPHPGPDLSYLRGPSVRHTLAALGLFCWWRAGCPLRASLPRIDRVLRLPKRTAQFLRKHATRLFPS